MNKGTLNECMFSQHSITYLGHLLGLDGIKPDNGPQFTSHEFRECAQSCDFSSVTSSPLYPRSNGQAERTVHADSEKAADRI